MSCLFKIFPAHIQKPMLRQLCSVYSWKRKEQFRFVKCLLLLMIMVLVLLLHQLYHMMIMRHTYAFSLACYVLLFTQLDHQEEIIQNPMLVHPFLSLCYYVAYSSIDDPQSLFYPQQKILYHLNQHNFQKKSSVVEYIFV